MLLSTCLTIYAICINSRYIQIFLQDLVSGFVYLPIKPERGFKADQLLLLPHLEDVAKVDARLSVEHESVLCILSLYETCMRRGSLS